MSNWVASKEVPIGGEESPASERLQIAVTSGKEMNYNFLNHFLIEAHLRG